MHGSLLLHSRPPSAPAIRQGVACIIPTVVAVCLRRLSRRLAKARPPRLHGPARQSLRQRQDRELHEDTQGRSRVSDGVRNLRGRYSRPSPLHRRGLQHSQTPLRARLSERNTRIATPSNLSKPPPETVHYQGRTPKLGLHFPQSDTEKTAVNREMEGTETAAAAETA